MNYTLIPLTQESTVIPTTFEANKFIIDNQKTALFYDENDYLVSAIPVMHGAGFFKEQPKYEVVIESSISDLEKDEFGDTSNLEKDEFGDTSNFTLSNFTLMEAIAFANSCPQYNRILRKADDKTFITSWPAELSNSTLDGEF